MCVCVCGDLWVSGCACVFVLKWVCLCVEGCDLIVWELWVCVWVCG